MVGSVLISRLIVIWKDLSLVTSAKAKQEFLKALLLRN